jgi:hypothetical protein
MRITLSKILVVLAAIVALLLSIAFSLTICGEGRFPMLRPAEDPDAVPVINAQELLKEFEENEAAARTKYEGRVWLRGRVTGYSGPVVTLEGPPGIQCVYVSGNDQMNMAIRKFFGREVLIEGNFSKRGEELHLFRPWKLKV